MSRGQHSTNGPAPQPAPAWWRGGVIYEIYPRSFQDTNGDGIGDLPGILRRLDHVARLGVDAVWIAPFFTSPMKDYGYDVADYREVDPLFGTLGDLDRVLARAHALGLRVLIDLVLSHTSDRHAWFLDSRSSRDDPKADWYVWADARPDGTPPNNWLASFGGPAWTFEPRRGQYYLHNFLPEQPDLNLHHPAVVDAVLAEAELWLARGVDGFRLDACDFYLHDPLLRDNPARPEGAPLPGGQRPGLPVSRQVRIRSKAHPDIKAKVLKPLRRLADRYGAVLLGELHGDGAVERAWSYTTGADGLHLAYTFELLHCPPTATALRRVVEALESGLGDGWACWSLANHDVVRPPSRFGGETPSDDLRVLLPTLVCCLRGTPCLYQGEELGLDQATLAYDDLRDPFGLAFWPAFPGRDGCRTPMPWEAGAPNAGFTDGIPWLPIPEQHRRRAVEVQERASDSVLRRLRRFLAWRRDQPALRDGDIRLVDAPDDVLAFERRHPGQHLLCCFNLAAEPREAPLARNTAPLPGHGFEQPTGGVLPPHGAFFGSMEGVP
jgi:alpha-glucosidase